MKEYNVDTMFPIQKLPMSKKTKQWKEDCVNVLVGKASIDKDGYGNTKKEMKIAYDLLNSQYDLNDLKYVTNPYKVDEGFPANPQNMNIIRPKINLLLGEETKRPMNLQVVRTSENASGEIQEKYKQMLMDYMQASVMANLSEEDRIRYIRALESGEIMPPEQIQKYITKSYKDVVEVTAYNIMNYLKQKLNVKHVFMRTWLDALAAGKEVLYVGVNNGEPMLERINPLYFSHDLSPDLEFIEDGEWCARKMYMTYTEIYDRLYDKMEESDLNKLISLVDNNSAGGYKNSKKDMVDDFNGWKFRTISNTINEDETSSTGLLPVWHVCWKSFKKIGFVALPDEQGNPQRHVVDENYVISGYEIPQIDENGKEHNIIWDWIIEVWEGYKIGSELYVGIQPLEYQHVSIDNPNSQKLPYTGAIYNNTNSKGRSLIQLLKPLQYMYIIIWYRLELAMARDKGKVLNIDITQIPKSLNIDVNKWAHYLGAMGINFVNPYETGWDIPGREGGNPSQFNQIAAIDLSMANVIDGYINLMDKIERMVSELSGVSDQREGSVSQYELANNVNVAVTQSALITEPLFWLHDQVKKRALTMVLNTAKELYKNSDKKKLSFILDDGTRAFINITEDFLFEDFDIFLSDNTKDIENLQMIKTLYQPAMQNGASLRDISEIMTLDNISMIRDRLSEIEDKRREFEQQMQQQEAEIQERITTMEQESKEQELLLKEAEMDLAKYKIDQDNRTKIVVAQMGAYRYQEDLDANNNGIPDPMEIAELALRRNDSQAIIQDNETKNQLKGKELDLKSKESDNKVKIEREKIKAAKELQAQKDKAAMAREQLKAKTALKNKVPGEKK